MVILVSKYLSSAMASSTDRACTPSVCNLLMFSSSGFSMWVTGSFVFVVASLRFSVSAWKPSNIQHSICCLLHTCFIHMSCGQTLYVKTKFKLRFPHYWQLRLKHTSCKNVVSTKNIFYLHLHKNTTQLHTGLLRICTVSSVSCTNAYHWLMTNCCFISEMQNNSGKKSTSRWKLYVQ